MKGKKSDIVTVTCYRQTETMTRGEAIAKFFEGMLCSEGAEHERYESIYFQLQAGAVRVSDMVNWREFY